jgi:uncharacterized membrane protein YedE/YeeE
MRRETMNKSFRVPINLDPTSERRSERFWNPYVAGVGLGLTLLLSFLTLGVGLGASGTIARVAASGAHVVASRAVEENAYFGGWFRGGSPLASYLVFMSIGVLVGGWLSAWSARRVGFIVERGPHASVRLRLSLALFGGLLAGFASRMAGGCTSGQALTGGALLLGGSWAFMMAVFGGAFAAAWFVRREWR